MHTTSIIAVAAVAGFVGFASSGAKAASTNGTANANLVTALTIAAGTALDFGSIVNAANTVTISSAGGRTATDSAQLAGGTPVPATFNVSGSASTQYSITLPANNTVTIANGATTLAVQNFEHNAGATPTLDGTGAASFSVGAQLIIVGGEAPGTYTGTFPVTVNY